MGVIALAVTAALGWGASDYLGGRATADRWMPVFAVVALSEALGVVGLIPVLSARGAAPPPLAGLAPAALAGVGVTVELALVYAALSRGQAFITAPVGALGAALAAAVGVAGGDELSGLAAVGLACALLGGGLSSWASPARGARGELSRNAIVAIGAAGAVCLTLSALHAAGRFDSYWATAIEHATTALCSGVLAGLNGWLRRRAGRVRPRAVGVRRRRLRWVALVAVTGTAGDVCYTAASHHGALTIVAAVSSLYPAATITLGRLLGEDRATRWQMIGIALALVGTVLLSAATR